MNLVCSLSPDEEVPVEKIPQDLLKTDLTAVTCGHQTVGTFKAG